MNKEKEEKKISQLQKAKEFADKKNYIWILIIILTIVYVVDELTSNVRGAVDSLTISDLYNVKFGTPEYDNAKSTLGFLTMGLYLIFLISPFYKSLADKFGRRIFLIINTIGMGVGMLVSILANNVALYLVGCVIMTFFTPNDMQVIYIMESAPKQHRAKICSITKGIALISVSLLGVFIDLFVNRDVASSWRNVYIIPIILAFIVGIASIFFIKETSSFASERLEYLNLDQQQREEYKKAQKEAKKNEPKATVFTAFKYIFSHKQTRAIALVAIIFAFATGYTGVYENILEAGISKSVLTADAKNLVLIAYPFFNGIFTLIGGFLTDKLGRKKSSLILGLWAAIGLAIFAYGCNIGINPYLTAFGYGFSIAGLWSISDMLYFIITSESTPTAMRSSVVGSMQLLGMVGTGLNMVFNNVAVSAFGAVNLGFVSSIVYLPIMCVALVIMMTSIKETKDVDLDNINIE